MTDIREHLPPASATAAPAAAVATTRQGRVVGPDGIQGLAALYVVLYHIFLRAWSGYPGANHAPSWATWLSYGRGAVAMFIVLSGFSLGLGPAGERPRDGGPGGRHRRDHRPAGTPCPADEQRPGHRRALAGR
jgi:hypothetical protein